MISSPSSEPTYSSLSSSSSSFSETFGEKVNSNDNQKLLNYHSFGDISQSQAEGILLNNNFNPGDYILWHNIEDNAYNISCVSDKKEIVHTPVDTIDYPLIAKISGIEESCLRQLDPAIYHKPKIIKQNERALKQEREHLLTPEVLEKVLNIASECVQPSRGIVVDKSKVPELNDREVAVIFEKKLRIYELLPRKENRLARGNSTSVFKVRNLRSGKICVRKLFAGANDNLKNKHEHLILERIHRDGFVSGIQKKFQTSVTIHGLDSGQYRGCRVIRHPEVNDNFSSFGACYEGDSNKIHLKLSPSNIKSFVTSLFHVFKGLQYCHEIGITNNDIKTHNIFFDGFELYLADFGGALDFKNLPKEVHYGHTGRYEFYEDMEDLRCLVQYKLNKENSLEVRKNLEQKAFKLCKNKDTCSLGIASYMMLTDEHPFLEKDSDSEIIFRTDIFGGHYEFKGKFLPEALINEYQVPREIAMQIKKVIKLMVKYPREKRIDMRQASEMLRKCLNTWDEIEAAQKDGPAHNPAN